MGEAVDNSRVAAAVGEVYRWIDSQVRQWPGEKRRCEECGRCCNFEEFDHRLFVTQPEVVYLIETLGAAGKKAMHQDLCPYNMEGRCSIYNHRFAACRIFFCEGDRGMQQQLSEEAARRFKAICEDLGVNYLYADLKKMLELAVNPCRPAG